MTVECDILFHARLHWVCVLPPLYQGGGVALSYIHPDPTAVELRSADFSPLPHGTRKCVGSGMNSALQVRSNSLNSIAVHPDPLPALCVPVLLQQRGEREGEHCH